MPDTPTRPTLTQRVVMWILHALMFYVVALYPVLLMARFQPDDIVHYGFLRWFAVVLVLYWGALQLFFTERPVDSRPGRQTLAVTAAILLIIGAFAPIVSFPFVGDIDFFREGYGDGYILLIMAGLSAALAVTGRWKQVLVPGLGSLAVILWTFMGVQDTVSQARSGGPAVLAGNPHEGLAPSVMASIQWDWGWILLFAGSCLLIYSATRREQAEDEYLAPAAVAVEEEPEVALPEAAAPEAAVEATAEEAAVEATAEEAAPAPTEAAPAAEPTGEPAADESAAEEEQAAHAAAPAAEEEAADPEEATTEGAAAEAPATAAPEPAPAGAETPVEETAEPAAAPEVDKASPPELDATAKPATATPEAAAGEPGPEESGAATAEAGAQESEVAAGAAEAASPESASADSATEKSAGAPADTDASTEEGQPVSKPSSDGKE